MPENDPEGLEDLPTLKKAQKKKTKKKGEKPLPKAVKPKKAK